MMDDSEKHDLHSVCDLINNIICNKACNSKKLEGLIAGYLELLTKQETVLDVEVYLSSKEQQQSLLMILNKK